MTQPHPGRRAISLAPETKYLADTVQHVTDAGTFEGYASLFGVADLGRDVVASGAFAASLARRGPAGVKMLWSHDPAQPIGTWSAIVEDGRGLRVAGRLDLAVGRAREVLALMRSGAVDGLSIGFRTERARTDKATGLRHLQAVDLWEISLVTFPMLPQARVSAVKARRGLKDATALRLRWRVAADDLSALAHRSPLTKDDTMTAHRIALETKSAGDPAETFEAFNRTFSAFREANDDRLAHLETRLGGDVLIDEKMARIDKALDETKGRLDRMAIERARPALGIDGKDADSAIVREHKAAFGAYMRSGEVRDLKALEGKALSAGSGPDGGYLVPVPAEAEILRRMSTISPIRGIATVQAISSSQLKKAYSFAGPASGWVGESDPRAQTASQQIADMSFRAMELYAMPAATQTLLDDAVFDIEQWIAEEVDTVFAEQEGAAFVNGDGVNKPTGFLSAPKVAQSAGWSWGKLGYVPTGVAGGFSAGASSDVLFDLVYALKAGYRQNGRFVMNRKTQSAIRKFKTTTGEYLWEPPASLGAPATLMNFPVVEAEDMPDIATGSFAIAFGDFRRGYLIVDRVGIRVLRDPYSAKPYVLFYTTKRVGGGIQDFDAIKPLKFDVA